MPFLFIFIIIFIKILIPFRCYSDTTTEDFFISTQGNLELDQITKTISTNKEFLFKNNKYTYSANNITIWYQDLNKLDLEYINRIESKNNIKIKTINNSNISADHYIYNLSSGVHILIAEKNPVVYKNTLYTLKADDRIEYFFEKNIIVVRGNPILKGKNNTKSLKNFTFSSKLINIKLENYDNRQSKEESKNFDKNVVFIEAIEKVTFIEGETTIKSDYAIYYKKENQIEFYDNVTFSNQESTLVGDIAIYNFKLGYGNLISKSTNTPLIGTYKPVKNKNEK